MKLVFRTFLNSLRSLKINERGVALLIVLSSIMVLTTAIVEFSFDTRIQYRLAVNNMERVQAYYLARSALNLSKLILKYNKEAESLIKKASESGASVTLEPLYRMVPLSSTLLRSMAAGEMNELLQTPSESEEETSADEGVQEAGEKEGTGEGENGGGFDAGVGMLDQEAAKKFLSFEGDFLAEISEEQTKFDLNGIASIESTSPAYDRRKKELLSILMFPKFKDMFENQNQDAEELVHALSDWVDANDAQNDFDNVTRGSEDSRYSHARYKVKNAKMLTLSEMRLVAGMTDRLYEALKPFVTVYSGSDKINVCLGSDEMVAGLILHYTQNSGCTPRVDPEDDKQLNELVSEVLAACNDVSAMSAALNSKLGLSDLEAAVAEPTTSSSATAVEGEAVAGCALQFKDLLTSDNNVFTIRSTGTVGDTNVAVVAVVNTTSSNPDQWKYYYYRVE